MRRRRSCRGLNENLRAFTSSASVSGTFKRQMVLQKLTSAWRPAERRPLTCRRSPNMIAFVLRRIFKWGFIKAWSVGRNTAILPNWYRCCVLAGVTARRLTKPPARLQWSRLHIHCNLAWVIDGGHAWSLSISTSRGEKWKQLICTNLNNSVTQKREKWKYGHEQRIKEEEGDTVASRAVMTAGLLVVLHKG